VVTNWVTALGFAGLLLVLPGAVDWSLWPRPLLAGMTFFLGQCLTFAAIRAGDVSIQGPVMGTKVVFVALGVSLWGSAVVTPSLWLGALLTAVAVFLLGYSGWGRRRGTLAAMGLAMAAAAAYAATDVQLTVNARRFGLAPFLTVMGLVNALLSLGLVPFFSAPLRRLPRASLRWFAVGAVLMGLQTVVFGWSLSTFAEATAQNIIYSARGFWSILLISVFAAFFGNMEAHVTRRMLVQRLTGTSLLLVAIALVLTEPV
jgi:drug/metabolite transporter (DMT)-like permease